MTSGTSSRRSAGPAGRFHEESPDGRRPGCHAGGDLPAAPSGTQPLPDTVLRRLEAGGNGFDVFLPQEAAVIAGLDEALESLARQTEESDRALRRDLEELRAATLRESDVSSRITGLLLVALACVVGQLLPGLWPRGDGARE